MLSGLFCLRFYVHMVYENTKNIYRSVRKETKIEYVILWKKTQNRKEILEKILDTVVG